MINFDNHDITAITYDDHSIQKVYGCDGNLVWEKQDECPECVETSFTDILARSTTARTGESITITPTIRCINSITVDISRTSRILYSFLGVGKAGESFLFRAKLGTQGKTGISYSSGWIYEKPRSFEDALLDGVSWITQDQSDPNKVTIDLSGLYGGNFTIESWQYNFNTDMIVSMRCAPD